MISLPLVRRTIRDYFLLWVAAAILLATFLVLFNFALDSVPRDQTEQWFKLPWVRSLISALVGADVAEFTKPGGLLSLGFSHPLVWVLLVAFSLTLASGALAGEVDRGTADVLATLPVSRATIYASVSVALVGMSAALCWFVWLGAKIGLRLTGFQGVPLDLFAIVTCNLSAAVVFVCCLGLAISAASDRRGMAVAAAFFLVFYSFVVNFLCSLWPALRPIDFTGFLHYYAPLVIIRDAAWPWKDMAALLAIAAVFWFAGLAIFVRRDIPAR
ncbi:MAG TPA: ABC transporter permease subunit [Phycisphaerae bacterium]|nr:ABC transporter permease subunit [Phycisphaerae bacterium]